MHGERVIVNGACSSLIDGRPRMALHLLSTLSSGGFAEYIDQAPEMLPGNQALTSADREP